MDTKEVQGAVHVIAHNEWEGYIKPIQQQIGKKLFTAEDLKRCSTLDAMRAFEREQRSKEKLRLSSEKGSLFFRHLIAPAARDGKLVICPSDGMLEEWLPADKENDISIWPLYVGTLKPILKIICCDRCDKPSDNYEDLLDKEFVKNVPLGSLDWKAALAHWGCSSDEKKYLLRCLDQESKQNISLTFIPDIDLDPEECDCF